ncbi:hypothetical protein ISN76_13170 [Dyella halodurans]|uniref:DUF4926 domain-containing protein n=1 Tax=Dyella halodurans TaxID=1920171 RepID=A0ABV9C060_9GAMM|nr:hypothetical protein [Dyella halodurans]
MDNPVQNYFPGRLLCFENQGNGDEACDSQAPMLEVTDAGNGFVEVAFTDRNERCYLAFRTSDLLRAIKEHGNG